MKIGKSSFKLNILQCARLEAKVRSMYNTQSRLLLGRSVSTIMNRDKKKMSREFQIYSLARGADCSSSA